VPRSYYPISAHNALDLGLFHSGRSPDAKQIKFAHTTRLQWAHKRSYSSY
jgi:hypothetical protein